MALSASIALARGAPRPSVEMVSGVYAIRCRVSDKMYVGSSNNVARRVRDESGRFVGDGGVRK